MASTAAASAVKEALVVAVCVVLLFHSSAGHQPPKPPRPPARRHCHSTGPSPSPSPLPPAGPTPTLPSVPTPTLTPTPLAAPPPTLPPLPVPTTPTPAPAPVNCSPNDCRLRCTSICQATQDAGIANCKSAFDSNLNGCHDECTNYTCPGGSCIPSGCNCPCDNANATSCCQACGYGWYSQYVSCERMYEKGFGPCMMDCGNTCYKNCTQGA